MKALPMSLNGFGKLVSLSGEFSNVRIFADDMTIIGCYETGADGIPESVNSIMG